jgi:hypothetical protein
MAEIVLINPKFEASFWGMEHALPYLGRRANLPVAALSSLRPFVASIASGCGASSRSTDGRGWRFSTCSTW